MVTKEIEISKIKIDVRLWEVEQEHITPIVDSINQIGLINPISVLEENGAYTLVAGEHRLRAYMQLGKDTIPANIFQREYEDIEKDKAKCILMEVDENLIRRSSDRFEESYMLYQRKLAYETLYPESKKENIVGIVGKNNGGDGLHIEIPKSFVQDTHDKTGIKVKTIEKKVKIGARMNEEDGKKADKLNISSPVLRAITSGNAIEETRKSANIHINTLEEIDSNFNDIGKRNSFYEKSFKEFAKKKEKETGEKYHLSNPVQFAEELKGKIETEYMPEYLNECMYEKTYKSVLDKFEEYCKSKKESQKDLISMALIEFMEKYK